MTASTNQAVKGPRSGGEGANCGPMTPHSQNRTIFFIGLMIIRVVGLWFGETDK
jgi:hypothetical protein